jgi:dynein heavy chain
MLQSLEEQLAKLTSDFEKATAEKMCCQKEADATNATIQLANRLVGGLASENVRWAESVAKYVITLPEIKRILLKSSFVTLVMKLFAPTFFRAM